MVTRIFLLALGYFATGWLGLSIPYYGSFITLVWLPTGIAVAGLLVWGRVVWPAIYLGAWLANVSAGSTWPLAAGIAVGNTLGPLLSVGWLRRVGFHTGLDRQKDVGLLIAGAGMGMTVSALGGVLSLYLAGLVPLESTSSAWLSWWMGDTVGVLLAAPLLLTLTRENIERLWSSRAELLLWLLVAGPVAGLAFLRDHEPAGWSLPLAFLTLPLIGWATLRFGKTGAALAGLGLSLVAAWGTATGHGTFFLPEARVSLFVLWGYMTIVVLTGLLITAMQAERHRVESSLRESEAKLRGLFELSPLGIARTDLKGRYVEFNDAFRKICGYPALELKTLDYWKLTPKKYEADEARQLESLARTGQYGPYEKEYVRQDGSLVPIQLNGMLITGSDGQDYIWSIVEDISARKRIEADLQVAATAFEAQVSIVVTDADSVILSVNRAFTEDTGYTAEEAVGQTPRLFKSGRHDRQFYAAMWDSILTSGAWQGEIWDRRKNGEIYPKWLTISAVKGDDGAVTHYVSTQFDISQRKAAEDEIKNLAFYDSLTHLPNRRLLRDRLQHALAATTRSQQHGALLFIDLDHFKKLNDTRGHNQGDLLLQQVAQRLSSYVREADTVARLGGDEFVVMLEGLSQDINEAAAQAEAVAEKILAGLNDTYYLSGQEYSSASSIGVTLFGDKGGSIEELLKQADLAMYQAKAAGRNSLRFFDPAMQAAVTAHVVLEKDLRNAVREGQFVVHYQVQVDEDGQPTGAEALVRWQHPQRGLVFPDAFIALAEETGLILPLGQWVLESACAQLAKWSGASDFAHLSLAVNISARQLHQSDFVGQVQAILDRTGIDPGKLKLELTESLFVGNMEDTIAKMSALSAKGVHFVLDDFGTGYSSLYYLKRLPLKCLKIDRSFVADVLTDANDAAIARTIVALAQNLNLAVVAEGVETREQQEVLARYGCKEYQGYLFSRPLPLKEFEQYAARLQRELLASSCL